MSGSTSTPKGATVSEALLNSINSKFAKGEWAECFECNQPIFKDMKCMCGYSLDKIVSYWEKELENAADEENKAIAESKNSNEQDMSEDFPKDAYDAFGMKKSPRAMFVEILFPYFVDNPAEWDDDLFGKTWLELAEKYLILYNKISQKQRSTLLDEVRNAGTSKEQAEAFKEVMKRA